jgi:hypothetical protein
MVEASYSVELIKGVGELIKHLCLLVIGCRVVTSEG